MLTRTEVLVLLLAVAAPTAGMAQLDVERGNTWYAGRWDASVFSDGVHPRTVAMRIQVTDALTLLPVSGVRVAVKGAYEADTYRANWGLTSTESREYELSGLTDSDGIAVLSLSWHKEFPWSLGRPQVPTQNGGWTYADEWTSPVDDVEKVTSIQTGHPRYEGVTVPFDLSRLLQVGQQPHSELQSQEVVERFTSAWQHWRDIPGVQGCLLNLDFSFPDFGKTSVRPEFFDAVRRDECQVQFGSGQAVGPYFVYSFSLKLTPLRRVPGDGSLP